MRIEEISSPGIIPSGQSLRQAVVKSINYLTVVSTNTGSSPHAEQLEAFFVEAAALAAAFKPAAPPLE